MITQLIRWWHRRLRATDKRILLPIILEKAKTKGQAMGALILHAINDPAWQSLSDKEARDLVTEWIEEGWDDSHT